MQSTILVKNKANPTLAKARKERFLRRQVEEPEYVLIPAEAPVSSRE